MKTRPARAQVPIELTWNLDDLFVSPADWETALEGVDAARAEVSPYQGRLGNSATTLLDCLNTVEAIQQRFIRVMTFAHLRNAQDGTNPHGQAAMARVAALGARLSASLAFVDSEVLQLPDGMVEQFLAAEPGLAAHTIYLQDLLELRPHRLSADTEQVLASLGEVMGAPSMIYNRSKTSDIQFAPFSDAAGAVYANSFNSYESNYESHEDCSVRRGAWQSFSAGLKAYNHTYAATFATEVKKNVVLARLRQYPSTEAFLLQAHKVPMALYSNILQIIQTELAPHMRRYARLRQRVLGLDKLLYCDIKAPLDPEFNPRVTYDEACELILDALAVMGPDYCAFTRTALKERWVDRSDNVGKSSGAFCASPYGVHPFILITWADSMRNVFTLAHELGHGGHFGLAMKHQRLVNTRPAMPFVEAPSIMNEMLLAHHVLGQSQDKRMRRSIIMQVLGTFHHNFVTHLLEAELQRQVYALAEAGQAITASVLNQRKGDILRAFWGDTVEIDEGACMTWMRQPHYYMGLYPYTYSVGLVASTAMARLVHDEGQPAVERWLNVLKAGGTLKPLELMQAAGIDMHSPAPIHDAVAYVGSLIDELELAFPV
ncbi:oligoendopeptidase F [Rhodoferax sp.]|uniref:oligoendopeptidase F n=1 Tax=Rhodoferax sp. TaxID=50421 RepID=UPI0027637C39|nr:oligoendopeptidase F [Rhodoferax sp.]